MHANKPVTNIVIEVGWWKVQLTVMVFVMVRTIPHAVALAL